MLVGSFIVYDMALFNCIYLYLNMNTDFLYQTKVQLLQVDKLLNTDKTIVISNETKVKKSVGKKSGDSELSLCSIF